MSKLVYGILFVIVLSFLAIIRYIYVSIKAKIKPKEQERITGNSTLIYNILSSVCVIIFGASWFFNIGWLRVIFLLPMLFHAIIFWVSNYLFHRYKYEPSKKISIVNVFVYVTYVFYYAILPDGGDTQESIRMFFGLMKNDKVIDIAFPVSGLILVVNICLIVIQIIYSLKIKKQRKNGV